MPKINGPELIHTGFYRTGTVKGLPLLTGELPVRDVHADHRGKIAPGAAPQGADPTGVNGILCRVPAQKTECLPAVQYSGGEDRLAAQAVFH